MKTIRSILIGIFAFVGLVFILAIIAVESPEKTAEATPAAPELAERKPVVEAPRITAVDLAKAYDENTVAADQRFRGKEFIVSGTIADINTDFMGDPYITLRGGVNPYMEPQFGFTKASTDALAKLKKGGQITVRCTGAGDVAKTPMSTDCSLL